MADPCTVETAARMLLRAAPGSKVILSGSHARGTPDRDNDLDFLVVEPVVTDRHGEMVRLRQVLRPLRIPVPIRIAHFP